MKYKYLKHLASRGASHIHPRGIDATAILIEKLSPAKGMKILELGCGTGATAAEVAVRSDAALTAVDALDEMIRAAKKRFSKLGLTDKIRLIHVSDNKPLPFDDNTFDAVYAESVLGFQKIEEVNFTVSEIIRVLKPGGRFLINESLWREDVPADKIKAVFEKAYSDFGLAPASESGITLNGFITLCNEAGLTLTDKTDLGAIASAGSKGFSSSSSAYDKQNKIKLVFSPAGLITELSYKKKISNYKTEPELIESWLLVFEKLPESQ